MCLHIELKQQPKVATRNIVCYKFLRTLNNGSYITPYQCENIEIGKTYLSSVILESEDRVSVGLHTFKNKYAAENLSFIYAGNQKNTNVIVKCIIPKGATYYKGYFGSQISYASDKLTYVKIVK